MRINLSIYLYPMALLSLAPFIFMCICDVAFEQYCMCVYTYIYIATVCTNNNFSSSLSKLAVENYIVC